MPVLVLVLLAATGFLLVVTLGRQFGPRRLSAKATSALAVTVIAVVAAVVVVGDRQRQTPWRDVVAGDARTVNSALGTLRPPTGFTQTGTPCLFAIAGRTNLCFATAHPVALRPAVVLRLLGETGAKPRPHLGVGLHC